MTEEREKTEAILFVLERANPMWPLYVGHPETGAPIEMSKETCEHIKSVLRQSLEHK